MSLWFRAYCDALDNPKIQLLEPELFKAWFNMMALAKLNDGRIPSMPLVAFRLRVDGETATRYLSELTSARLLDLQADGSWSPHDWEEHQYESDSAAERMRRHRKKKSATSPVTELQSPVTSPVTSPDRNALRNGYVPEQSRAEQKRAEAFSPIPAGVSAGSMDRVRELWESTNKPLNDQDWILFAHEIASQPGLDDSVMRADVIPFIESQIYDWQKTPNPKFVPFPAKFMKEKPWTRKAKATPYVSEYEPAPRYVRGPDESGL